MSSSQRAARRSQEPVRVAPPEHVVPTRPLEVYVLGETDFQEAVAASVSFREQLRRVYFLRH